jgi:hypothetical protein
MNVIELIVAIIFVFLIGLLSFYIAILSYIPIVHWLVDGGLVVGVWSLLAVFVFIGMWWVLMRDYNYLGWLWLIAFIALHLGLYLPQVWEAFEADGCIDRGGSWQSPQCIMKL